MRSSQGSECNPSATPVVTVWITTYKLKVISKMQAYLNFVSFLVFLEMYSLPFFQMCRVLLKLEGKSIFKHTVFIYCSRSCNTSKSANKCDEEFDGRCLRRNTTCTHLSHKGEIQFDLCKARWPFKRFLKVNTDDLCALPFSSSSWQTNRSHYFAYM